MQKAHNYTLSFFVSPSCVLLFLFLVLLWFFPCARFSPFSHELIHQRVVRQVKIFVLLLIWKTWKVPNN